MLRVIWIGLLRSRKPAVSWKPKVFPAAAPKWVFASRCFLPDGFSADRWVTGHPHQGSHLTIISISHWGLLLPDCCLLMARFAKKTRCSLLCLFLFSLSLLRRQSTHVFQSAVPAPSNSSRSCIIASLPAARSQSWNCCLVRELLEPRGVRLRSALSRLMHNLFKTVGKSRIDRARTMRRRKRRQLEQNGCVCTNSVGSPCVLLRLRIWPVPPTVLAVFFVLLLLLLLIGCFHVFSISALRESTPELGAASFYSTTE
jgi:hypothetical protein